MVLYAPEAMKPSDDKRNALRIANDYLQGEAEPFDVVGKLRSFGSFGALLGGEVLVDFASTRKPEAVRGVVTRARHFLEAAQNIGEREAHENGAVSQARARFRLAQLSSQQVQWSHDLLPTPKMARSVYKNTLTAATDLVNIHEQLRPRINDSVIEMKGIIAEATILLLLQRFARREVGSTTWMPFSSLLKEDHGSDCLRKTDKPAWNVSIYTKDSEQPTKLTYALQVKRSLQMDEGRPDEQVIDDLGCTVQTITVAPDLMLRREHHNETAAGVICRRIIGACAIEYYEPQRAERLTKDLDARTELLLDTIG